MQSLVLNPVGSDWIRIRPDPATPDPVWIRIRPDPKILDPVHPYSLYFSSLEENQMLMITDNIES